MTKPLSLKILMIIRPNERLLRDQAITAAGRHTARFFEQLGKAFKRQRRNAVIAKLDDRTLADIGLSRSDVQDAMSQPLWAFKPLALRRWWQGGDPHLDALARLDDGHISSLSETGQRLRRKARRPR